MNATEQAKQSPTETSADIHFLDYWRVVRARKEIILAVTLLVGITGSIITFMLPRIYSAACLIRVYEDKHDVEVFDRGMSSSYNPYFMLTEYEVIQSRPILNTVVQNLDLQKTWGEQYNEDNTPLDLRTTTKVLSNSLNVEQYRNTSLIAIKVSREDPEEASQVANEIASSYREFRLSLKKREIRRGLESLENELLKQKEDVDKAELEVERIRKELGITFLGKGYSADKLKLQQLEAERIALKVEVLARKARLDQLEALDDEALISAVNQVVYDKTLDKVRLELLDAEVRLRLMLENLGENHPEVKTLRAGADELRTKLKLAINGLKDGIRVDYEVFKAKYLALEEELSLAKESDIEMESEKMLPFAKAEREMLIQRSLLEALNARLQQEGIELEIPMTPVEIIEFAIPPSRFSQPNIPLNIILSLFVGITLGIGLAFFLEYLDTSVKTVDDIERYLGLPVVGIIPQKVKPLNQEGPDSPHAEAYRVLRTNLQFAMKDQGQGGAFAAISGGVGEGKSTTLFNLAYICAYMGDKVLVVDSDLRRPVQHTFFDMSNRFGLTNVLLRDVPIEETIKATEIPNLHFLPSGKLPRSSIGLLDNQRIRELVKNLKARYDYVFFDSPPVMGVSDASILAAELDGILLVVQYRKYPRMMSARAKRLLENVGGNIIGVVLNNINILRDDYYYYYNTYYSHYNTGHESSDSSEESVAGSKERF